jgi:hypothetical protein
MARLHIVEIMVSRHMRFAHVAVSSSETMTNPARLRRSVFGIIDLNGLLVAANGLIRKGKSLTGA